jgi:hypothetical protein
MDVGYGTTVCGAVWAQPPSVAEANLNDLQDFHMRSPIGNRLLPRR